MRIEAEPIEPRHVVVSRPSHETIKKIRRFLEEEWKLRMLDEDVPESVIITAPYHFATETGFGQPAGGRKYYTQLRIEVVDQEKGAAVDVSHYHFEIRTSYAYNKDGKLGTMYKHYPYEEYPGMFDLSLINNEMNRVAVELKKLFQE